MGKIAIPKEIINKPGKLDPHEWTIVKTHTLEGQKMLDRVGGFMRQVGSIVRSHHERWDGGGYPDGLVGEQIPLEARIDLLLRHVERDAHRPPLPQGARLRRRGGELQTASGGQLDPKLVDALLELVASEAPEPEPQPDPGTELEAVSLDAAGARQPRPEFGYARQAC